MGIKISKIKAFLTGWGLTLTFSDNREAKRKRKICSTCKNRKGLRCGLCGCPIRAISLANDNDMCDAGKW
jgi:hypothetical protein